MPLLLKVYGVSRSDESAGLSKTGVPNVSEKDKHFSVSSNKNILTVKQRVCNETARIDGLAVNFAQRLAVSATQRTCADVLALELVRIETLDIATVVLEEVGQLVVQQHRWFDIVWNVKFDYTLLLAGYVRHRAIISVVEERISRRIRLRRFVGGRTEVIRVLVRRNG